MYTFTDFNMLFTINALFSAFSSHFFKFVSRCFVYLACSSNPQKMILSAALRAAAATVKHEDERRLFHNAALRKRRKEMVDRMDTAKTQIRVHYSYKCI